VEMLWGCRSRRCQIGRCLQVEISLAASFFITVFWTSSALSNKDEYLIKIRRKSDQIKSKRLSDTNLN